MKFIVVLATVLAVAFAEEYYSSKYDGTSKRIVGNSRIMENYLNCFIAEGPCTPDAKDLNKIIPEAMQTNCAKCSPSQKDEIKLVANKMKELFPAKFEKLLQIVDPNNQYKENIDKFLA